MTDKLIAEPGKPIVTGPYAVLPEWIDYNGHMNIAYYVVAFDKALDDLYDAIGCGEDYRKSTDNSSMTLELHINYIREIFEGDPFVMEFIALGVWDKRVQFFCSMRHGETGELSATFEIMIAHVSMTERRASPFPDWLFKTFDDMVSAHATVDRPKQVGRAIGMPVSK